MKLLFDENLSYRLVKKLSSEYPDSLHVKRIGLPIPRKDIHIFNWAKKNKIPLVISQDSDFSDIVAQYGPPPKIIWLRTGNLETDLIAKILMDRKSDLEQLIDSKEQDVLVIK